MFKTKAHEKTKQKQKQGLVCGGLCLCDFAPSQGQNIKVALIAACLNAGVILVVTE